MNANATREQTPDLSREYNKELFYILHILIVEGTIRWYVKELGYGDDKDFWGIAGLPHDVDLELYPEEHCVKMPELLELTGVSDELIYTVCRHDCGICSDVEPMHEMEKVLFIPDELAGFIGVAVRMHPSKSVMDMEMSNPKKKFKDERFVTGCSCDVAVDGTEKLGWTLEELTEKTILAMYFCEERVQGEMDNL